MKKLTEQDHAALEKANAKRLRRSERNLRLTETTTVTAHRESAEFGVETVAHTVVDFEKLKEKEHD